MKKLLQIDTCLGVGSTGRITESIARLAQGQGWECYIIHGARYVKRPSCMTDIQSVSVLGEYAHFLGSLLFDNHGLDSACETKRVVEQIKQIKPDIIHLHCIHGYYINYKVLFEYLRTTSIPVVWTFHDCWAFTGHCAYFDSVGCEKWKVECGDCELKKTYPKSLVLDRSRHNYQLKKELFTSIGNQTRIVTVSNWLEGLVEESFLNGIKLQTIHNGIDLEVFKPRQTDVLKQQLKIDDKSVILGVAMPWSRRKGLEDMLKLATLLPRDRFQIVLIGLDDTQIQGLPNNVIGLKRTDSAETLAEFYSLAEVFVNPTYEDNFPTVNLEALACGTPVITYKTGGSPEAVDDSTGWVVEQGRIDEVARIVENLSAIEKQELELQRRACRLRAEKEFDKDKAFKSYLDLYTSLTS